MSEETLIIQFYGSMRWEDVEPFLYDETELAKDRMQYLTESKEYGGTKLKLIKRIDEVIDNAVNPHSNKEFKIKCNTCECENYNRNECPCRIYINNNSVKYFGTKLDCWRIKKIKN